MSRASGRTQRCSAAEAKNRLAQAQKFRDVADLVAGEPENEYASVAASLAVLAGIAACDAACCKALGRRSRGQDHHEAEELVGGVEPGGKSAAHALRRLLNMKDEAQYGFYDVSGKDLQSAVRQANSLVAFAEDILAR